MAFNDKDIQWFYIKPMYKRDWKIKDYFDKKHCNTYIPMHEIYREIEGKPVKATVPLISSMLFVRTSWEMLKDEKMNLDALGMPFMLRMDSMHKSQPIVIPDNVMENFKRVCADEYSRYIDSGVKLDKIKKGNYVEVIDGKWKGLQGFYARPWKDKCVVVAIEGVCAVCTTYLPPAFLRIIDKPKNVNMPDNL